MDSFVVENSVLRVATIPEIVVQDSSAVTTNVLLVVPATMNAYQVSSVIRRRVNVSLETSNV